MFAFQRYLFLFFRLNCTMDISPDMSALSATSPVMSTSTESSSTMMSFEMSEEKQRQATVDYINDIAYNYVALCIVGIGILGNILNLIVLTRPKLKGKFTIWDSRHNMYYVHTFKL